MAGIGEPGGALRFGGFELDPDTGELHSNGRKHVLRGQPYQILMMLLERPGKLITRDELKKRLWPSDTFVDFDHSLNKAVNRLRESLGDSAEQPRFIETLAGRGYRLIVPVSQPEDTRQAAPEKQKRDTTVFGYLLIGGGLSLAVAGWMLLRPKPAVPVASAPPNFLQVTADGRSKQGPLVIDGQRILFTENLPGPRLVLAQSGARGGGTTSLQGSFQQPKWADISPDRTKLLVLNSAVEAPYSIWVMPEAGGTPRRVGNADADDAIWCQDGHRITYALGRDIYVMNEDGTGGERLATAAGRVSRMKWSPDGQVLRFTVMDTVSDSTSLWQLSADGLDLHEVLPGWNTPASECCGTWTPDGKYYVFQSAHDGRTDIWAMRETAEEKDARPVRVTSGPLNFTDPSPAEEGNRIFVVGMSPRAELMRRDAASGKFVPFVPGVSAEGVAFSRDGQWMTYVAYPEGTVWRSKADGTEKLQLTFAPKRALLPRWSPDGKQIVFTATAEGGPWKIYVVSSDGGEAQALMEDDQHEGDPTWSADGNSIVFGGDPRFDDNHVGVRVFNLKSHEITTLPDSDGLFSPRASPTGRFIVALTVQNHDLKIFDSQTHEWSTLTGPALNYPSFSRDGNYIYFQDWSNYYRMGEQRGQDHSVHIGRIGLKDRKVESVAEVQGIAGIAVGTIMAWSGLAPDDTPLMAREIGSQEIYSLEWMGW